MLWSESGSDAWGRFFAALAASAVASAQAAATTSRRRAREPASVRVLYAVGVAGAALFAALVSLAVWQEVEDEAFYRFLGALAVAVVLVTVLQPILQRTGRREAGPEPAAGFVVRLEDGRELDCPPDLESAIANLERDGANVVRIERR